MKAVYWEVTDEQVVGKMGKVKSERVSIPDDFNVSDKKSNEVAAHLQQEYDVQKYWAQPITRCYLKQKI
ncbi:MAG: hypothetical protein CFE23_08035 [Flavobacterium sp. BFFFF1]|uniref:hypothetical protein n=1 Tax=Flavobacterium sp. BFFFF1 TaxID=2015557 RepID=UPI000BDDA275|nr:hypothetical protein [Flavobacterium sp. BFFFF1]OYU80664.1 MAG: hypothetical protein CFE23_08035 [Flavobacterium sp. BFFFF1]